MNITGNNSIKGYVFDGGYSGFLSMSGLNFNKSSILDPSIAPLLINGNIDPIGVTGYAVFFNKSGAIDAGYLTQNKLSKTLKKFSSN